VSGRSAAEAALTEVVRVEGSWVLATLTRTVGSLDLAQDCVQDAVERALQVWPRVGVPDNPRAWLMLTARRRAVDVVRREMVRRPKEEQAAQLWGEASAAGPGWGTPGAQDAAEPAEQVTDDLLRLIFTCCHPSLDLDTQVALSLRTLCGFSNAEVARALLVSEPALAKRLTRARQKIKRAAIPYRVPAAAELPARLSGVCAVLYLIFNEGYAATAGPDAVRTALTRQAIRLTRLVGDLLPGRASLTGLLALMVLQEARREARLDPRGALVLLRDQDRTRWDGPLIHEGVIAVGEGLRLSAAHPDPYVIQAAIAACHDLASSFDATDWSSITSWYDVLLTVDDTAVTRLNAAAAVAERDGPSAGLELMDGLVGLERYPTWHAARGELLAKLLRHDEAADAFRAALGLEMNEAQRALVTERLQAAESGST